MAAISCGIPQSPANGSFHGFQYTVGSKVNYQCNEGYRMETSFSTSAVCLEEGAWSNAAHPPLCLREKNNPLFLCQRYVKIACLIEPLQSMQFSLMSSLESNVEQVTAEMRAIMTRFLQLSTHKKQMVGCNPPPQACITRNTLSNHVGVIFGHDCINYI